MNAVQQVMTTSDEPLCCCHLYYVNKLLWTQTAKICLGQVLQVKSQTTSHKCKLSKNIECGSSNLGLSQCYITEWNIIIVY